MTHQSETGPGATTVYAAPAQVQRTSRTMKHLLTMVAQQHLIWVLLAVVMIIGVTVPGFLSTRNIVNVLWASAPLGCMVLGMFFVMLTGGLDLSLESTFALGPTLVIVALAEWLPEGVWPGFGVVAVPVIGALIGLFNGLFAVSLRVNAFLVTLATLLVMRGVVIYLIPEGVYYLPDAIIFLGNVKIAGFLPVAVVVWIALYAIAFVIINYHRLGKDIFALGNNEEAAFIAGVNVSRTRILCFVIAGTVAAIGGLLEVGRLSSVVADLGEGDILMVFAGTILGGTALTGGVGRVGGIFAAVLVIAMIENLMNLYGVEPSIRQIVFGCILMGAIYLASLQGRLRVEARD